MHLRQHRSSSETLGNVRRCSVQMNYGQMGQGPSGGGVGLKHSVSHASVTPREKLFNWSESEGASLDTLFHLQLLKLISRECPNQG
jgi:hypothetical protein